MWQSSIWLKHRYFGSYRNSQYSWPCFQLNSIDKELLAHLKMIFHTYNCFTGFRHFIEGTWFLKPLVVLFYRVKTFYRRNMILKTTCCYLFLASVQEIQENKKGGQEWTLDRELGQMLDPGSSKRGKLVKDKIIVRFSVADEISTGWSTCVVTGQSEKRG